MQSTGRFLFSLLGKKKREEGWFISENKTPAHPLSKYLVFEMPNLSAKENFGLETQAPCTYTKKYLLVLYVTASQPASQPHLN